MTFEELLVKYKELSTENQKLRSENAELRAKLGLFATPHKTEQGIDRVLGELARCGKQFVEDIKEYLKNGKYTNWN